MAYSKIKKVSRLLKQQFSNFDNLLEHEAIIAAEESGDNTVLDIVATALVNSKEIIKSAVLDIDKAANKSFGELEESDIDEIAVLAEEFDKSKDPFLQKQASVLDQILVNFGQKDHKSAAKLADDKEIERLRAKQREQCSEECYKGPTKTLEKDINAADSVKAIDGQVKRYRPLEAALSTRTCPDHPGAQMGRIGDGVFQCSADNKIYNYHEGFTTLKGNDVPGGDVSEQTRSLREQPKEEMSFSTRDSVLNDR